MRDLLVMRHGRAMTLPGLEHAEMPLHNRGERAVQRIGVWLWQQELRPDLVLTSPAERALVSAEHCCMAMDRSAAMIREDERLYRGGLDEVLAVLAERAADAARVLVVLHRPACDDLVRHLAQPHRELAAKGRLLRRATLAHLQTEDPLDALQPGNSQYRRLVSGRELPKRFPYPPPDGKEGRKRPAYYYTQSGVIPYRERKGRFEVLVIQSSQRDSWMVPKGVCGPGRTPQESAAEEALEEAGVTGRVLDMELGSYGIDKWGARCTVTLFPMQVQRVLQEAEWEEQHRARQWLPVATAAERVNQPELKQMILELPQRLSRRS